MAQRKLDPDKVLASGLTVRETLVFQMAPATGRTYSSYSSAPEDIWARATVAMADAILTELARQPDPAP